MSTGEVRFWDANIYIAVLEQEEDRVEMCVDLLNLLETGDIRVIISAFALIEVIGKRKGQPPAYDPSKCKTITDMMRHRNLQVFEVDRNIGNLARGLIWEHHLDYKDAVHLATALWFNDNVAPIASFDTYDRKDLIVLSEKHGSPPLKICHPDIPEHVKVERHRAAEAIKAAEALKRQKEPFFGVLPGGAGPLGPPDRVEGS